MTKMRHTEGTRKSSKPEKKLKPCKNWCNGQNCNRKLAKYWKIALSESLSYKESRQKWDTQKEQENQGSQRKILSLVGINAMDKIVAGNWQNMEKLHCQNHWAKESLQKWDTQKEQENQASQRKSLSLVGIDAMGKNI